MTTDRLDRLLDRFAPLVDRECVREDEYGAGAGLKVAPEHVAEHAGREPGIEAMRRS